MPRGALACNIKQPRARLQTGSSTRTTRTNFARASRRWTFTRGPAPGTAPPRVSTCVHVCADSVRVRVCARYTVCSSCVRAAAREGAQRVAFRDVRAIAKHRFSASGRQAVRPLSSGFNALSRRALLDRLTVWLVSLRRGRGLTCLWLGRLAFRLPFGLFSRHLRLERCKVGLHPCLEIEKVVVVSISC